MSSRPATPATLFLLVACTTLLAACGTRGPLTLPGATPTQTKAAPPSAAPTKAAGDHNSTPTPPAPQ